MLITVGTFIASLSLIRHFNPEIAVSMLLLLSFLFAFIVNRVLCAIFRVGVESYLEQLTDKKINSNLEFDSNLKYIKEIYFPEIYFIILFIDGIVFYNLYYNDKKLILLFFIVIVAHIIFDVFLFKKCRDLSQKYFFSLFAFEKLQMFHECIKPLLLLWVVLVFAGWWAFIIVAIIILKKYFN